MNLHDRQWYIGVAVLGTAAFVLDRALKYIALHNFVEPMELIPGLLHLSLYYNPNIVFFLNPPVWLMLGVIGIVFALLVNMALKDFHAGRHKRVALFVLIAIGALSNVLDRVQFGYVIDFINVPFWAVFNFADIYIVVSVLILLLASLNDDGEEISAKN